MRSILKREHQIKGHSVIIWEFAYNESNVTRSKGIFNMTTMLIKESAERGEFVNQADEVQVLNEPNM